jgi:hypothetical protein
MNHAPNKPKNQATLAVVNRYGFVLAVFTLLIGALIGALAMFIGAPTLYGHSATQASLNEQAQQVRQNQANVDSTQGALGDQFDLLATQSSIALTEALLATDAGRLRDAAFATQTAINFAYYATEAHLSQLGQDLAQTATQSSAQIFATRTAASAQNVQQQTQVAIDYAATQGQLQQAATQAQLSFQATQAALQGNNSAPLLIATATP